MDDLVVLKARIPTLESRIREGNEELCTLVKVLKDAEAARAIDMALPARDFPPEILVRIFATALSVRCNDEYSEAHSTWTSLRLVCSLWNQVVLHYSGLWANAFINGRQELEVAQAMLLLQAFFAFFGQQRKLIFLGRTFRLHEFTGPSQASPSIILRHFKARTGGRENDIAALPEFIRSTVIPRYINLGANGRSSKGNAHAAPFNEHLSLMLQSEGRPLILSPRSFRRIKAHEQAF